MNSTTRIGLNALLFLGMLSLGACGGNDAKDDLTTGDSTGNGGATAPRETGTITGRVTLAGEAPELTPFAITANADVCGTASKSNLLELGQDKGIAGAVVYVEMPELKAAPSATQTIEQRGCQYTPHVIATTPGSTVAFRNDDPTAHNVRVESVASGRIQLNVAQGAQGKVDEWKVPEAGFYLVACDYHPWMNSYVVAVPSGLFAVTGADGTYRIDGVPVGSRTVIVWHNGIKLREKHDTEGRLIGYRFDDPVTKSSTVSVAKNASATLDVALELATDSAKTASR
jgi:plastocyanin